MFPDSSLVQNILARLCMPPLFYSLLTRLGVHLRKFCVGFSYNVNVIYDLMLIVNFLDVIVAVLQIVIVIV